MFVVLREGCRDRDQNSSNPPVQTGNTDSVNVCSESFAGHFFCSGLRQLRAPEVGIVRKVLKNGEKMQNVAKIGPYAAFWTQIGRIDQTD